MIENHYVQFFTAVCHEWLHLLKDEESKQIIIEALKFRIAKGQVKVCAYVIMPNHIHVIWRIQNDFKEADVRRDFLKYTAKQIIEHLHREAGISALEPLFVDLKDRKYQVWKRNSMSIDLESDKFFEQKFRYLHENPCQPHWNLASHPCDYRFSSARYYEVGIDEFEFLTHCDEI